MRDEKFPCVYNLASGMNGALYIGVTSDLWSRMSEHKQRLTPGFASKYGVDRLVYYETHETMELAIRREKQLKKWNRAWKIRLIEQMNPGWLDLFDEHDGSIKDGPSDTNRERNWVASLADTRSASRVATHLGPRLRGDDGMRGESEIAM